MGGDRGEYAAGGNGKSGFGESAGGSSEAATTARGDRRLREPARDAGQQANGWCRRPRTMRLSIFE